MRPCYCYVNVRAAICIKRIPFGRRGTFVCVYRRRGPCDTLEKGVQKYIYIYFLKHFENEKPNVMAVPV